MPILLGVDIGGTKCAVVLGKTGDQHIRLGGKRVFATPNSPDETIELALQAADELMNSCGVKRVDAVGVSCGSPLDSRRGFILAPPNLPGWERVDILRPLRDRFHAPAGLQNDANACALAEWRWGAGRGCRNMIFLTFGTGMGAGLILDGRLYTGSNDLAGEVGHIRLAEEGPIGFGKSGSFEGFCSGGGIARLAVGKTKEWLSQGVKPAYCPNDIHLPSITAKSVAEAANAGDPHALEIYQEAASYLGRGLAVLIDILNPERIVIGSIYARQQALMEHRMMEALRQEALPGSLEVCRILPAALGESVGDYASLSVAYHEVQER